MTIYKAQWESLQGRPLFMALTYTTLTERISSLQASMGSEWVSSYGMPHPTVYIMLMGQFGSGLNKQSPRHTLTKINGTEKQNNTIKNPKNKYTKHNNDEVELFN